MEPSLDIVSCDNRQRAGWDTYLEGSPTSTICHHFLWQPIIKQAYGHQPLYLMARSNGWVRGVLPLFYVKSRLFGKSLTSLPFLDYGGVCADDETTAKLLLEHAQRVLHESAADYVELRQCTPPPQSGALRMDKVGMRLELSSGVDGLWQSFPVKVRNQVRKAMKAGLHTRIGGGELLDEFYDVFAVNMRDLGSPVHHKAFFAHIFAQFGMQSRLVLVCDGQRTVGGLVCLFFKDTVTVPWASSLRDYFSKCPNNLLYWEAIRYACAHGCKYFDFGRSSIGSGTYNFKRQWGAQPVQIYWHVLSKNGRQSLAFAANTPKGHIIVEVWKRLPVSFTKLLGPRIRKYLTN